MLRTLIYFIELAAVLVIAVWLAARPGHVAVDWQGWRIETSVGALTLTIFLLVVGVALLYRAWRWMRRQPHEIALYRRHQREANGYRALTDGLAAVAAGDAGSARKLARRAQRLLQDPPLTLLLSAQAAQLDGDEASARKAFEEMLERPETEFLGLRGLILQALREGNEPRALRLAERAHVLEPQAPWLLDTLISLHSKAGNWRAAQSLVEQAQRKRRLPAEQGRRQQAVLLTERARDARQAGNLADALEQARRANELNPSLTPAALLRARLVAGDGRARRARKVLERAWQVMPHPGLAEAYADIAGGVAPLDRYRAIEALTRGSRERPESRYALAHAALAAKLWGEAGQHLTALEASEPTARVYRLYARLAEEDGGDEEAARNWLDKAAEAEADNAWVCEECGTVADDWSGVCGQCHAFATLAWKQPPRVHRAVVARPEEAVDETAVENG